MSETVRSDPREGASYIPTLDGWRAIAVSLVIGAHATVSLRTSGSALLRGVGAFFEHTGFGVDIFFALSGYLICTLLLREKERTGTVALGRFYTRRAFRILPPLLLYLLTVMVLAGAGRLPQVGGEELASVLLFFRNYIYGTWYTGHFWSLAVEEHFYLFAPLMIALLPRKRAMWLATALVCACVAIRWFEYHQGWDARALIQFHTETRCDGLLWGAILAIALRDGTVVEWISSRYKSWMAWGAFFISAAGLVLLKTAPERRTIVAVAVPLFLVYGLTHPRSLFRRLLEWRPLAWLGRISYSLYLWQMLFLPEAERPLGVLQSFPLALVLPVVCATLSFYLVEKPMMRTGHRIAGSPAKAKVYSRRPDQDSARTMLLPGLRGS